MHSTPVPEEDKIRDKKSPYLKWFLQDIKNYTERLEASTESAMTFESLMESFEEDG